MFQLWREMTQGTPLVSSIFNLAHEASTSQVLAYLMQILSLCRICLMQAELHTASLKIS